MKKIKTLTALAMSLCLLAGTAAGCGTAAAETAQGAEKRITIAIGSETGGMDPAGNIALTYLKLIFIL